MKIDGFDAYKTDPDLEAGAGVRVEYDDGRAFLLHRAGGANTKFKQLFAEKMKPHQRKYDTGTLASSVQEQIMREVIAESVVIGWEGITSDGQPVPFSLENCLAVFEAYPELFAAVQRDAMDLALFTRQNNKDVAKNSEPPSDGNSSGAASGNSSSGM